MDTTTIKNGAAYIRVSTDKQEELSPDAQKRMILEYAKKNNILILSEDIYIENGISGRKAEKRPQFQKMIAKAKSKEHPYDVILVWKYSRFARNQEESIVYKSMLKRDHVDVISISEPVIDGPFGTLIERIIEWMDEYYSIRLSGEVKRGMTEKALRGGYQSVAPFGYITRKGDIPIVNHEQAVIVRRIFNDFLNGKSCTRICREINAMGVRTIKGNLYESRMIRYMLENPFYIGKVRWNYSQRGRNLKPRDEWIIVDGEHEPIIDIELWDAVQEKLKSTSVPFKSRDISTCKHWLSGIVKCSSCGATLGFNSSAKTPFFQCWKYSKGVCRVSHAVTQNKLEQAVLDGLEDSLLSPVLSFHVVRDNEDTDTGLLFLREQLKRITAKEKRIKDAYINEIDTLEEYRANKEMLQSEREKIQKQIDDMTYYQENKADYDRLLRDQIRKVLDVLHSDAGYVEKGAALRSVVESVTYDKTDGHLSFFFRVGG